MDDQRIDRTGWRRLIRVPKPLKRPQLSLRLMLMLVAFFAILFGSLAIRRDQRTLDIRWELQRLEADRKRAERNLPYRPTVKQIDAEIAKQRNALSEQQKLIPTH